MLTTVRTGSPFATALDSSLGTLDDRDRRLAHEIAAGVLRTRTDLDQRLKPLVTADWRRVSPDLKDVLRIGAYQLLHLDRIPAHAAVETTVDLARASVGAGAAGMVNAVLRKLAANPGTGTTESAGHSHPEWLVKRWQEHFGADRTRALIAHNNRQPPLVIQPARWSLDRLAGALAGSGIAFDRVEGAAGFAVHTSRVNALPGFEEGGFVVQDPAQARVMDFAAIPDGALVWDACAAPGGKAVVLAQRHRVVATEVRADRLDRLRQNARRAAPTMRILRADARTPPFSPGSMDAVLLDAPCSATGTLARHPDARWKLSERRIEVVATLQQELLDSVWTMVKPGGMLVYATCSLEPEENDLQVNAFLARHDTFRRATPDLHIFPGDTGTDGAYAARLERAA